MWSGLPTLTHLRERDSRSGVRPHGLTPHMLFLTTAPRLHDSSFYVKCNTFAAVQPVFVNTTMLCHESANLWKQVPEWSLLITQPPDQLCKLAGRPVWECGDVMAHFTHLHYGFSQISMHEDYEQQWWITERCLCLWLSLWWLAGRLCSPEPCVPVCNVCLCCGLLNGMVHPMVCQKMAYVLQPSRWLFWLPSKRGFSLICSMLIPVEPANT